MRIIQRSFAGGEIAPELFGRVDLPLYQTSIAGAENFVTLPHGPASYRPGFEYIQQAKYANKVHRLIPFVFSADQQYVIEFGHLYVRFHTDGGTVLESSKVITGITLASPGVITIAGHGYSDGDWLYVDGGNMTELATRYYIVDNATTNTFTLTSLHGVAIDTTDFTAYTSGGTASRVYEVATDYTESQLFDVAFAQSNDVLTLVHIDHPPRRLSRTGAASWTYGAVSFGSAASPPTAVAVSSSSTGTSTYKYVVTSLVGDIDEESVASSSVSINNDLTIDGTKNTITWTPPASYNRFRVYKEYNGLYGYIGSTDSATFDDNYINPDMTQTPPENNTPFSGAGNYPSAVGYRGQRKIFAATANDPQKFWMTKPGTEANLNKSVPVQDDDAIIATLSSQRQNKILSVVNDDEVLLVTNGGVWKISGDGNSVLSPSTVSAKKQRSPAAHKLRPLDVSDAILYVQAGGTRVIDLIYDWQANTFTGQDVSLFAMHLIEGYSITDWANTAIPYPMVWCVRSDGTLLCLSYLKQQQIQGWTKHATSGSFESVASINENGEDRLYASVKRTIGGTDYRYIERMASMRQTGAVEDMFYVDSGLTYDGAETDTITGLWHLEGQTLSILADGSVQPDAVVTDGTITLQEAASKVTAGLGYTGYMQSLPMAIDRIEAFGQGRAKNAARVFIRLNNSRGMFAGPSLDKLTEYKQRTNEGYGVATALKSDEIEMPVYGEWTRGGQVWIQQPYPLPCTVASIVVEVEVGK